MPYRDVPAQHVYDHEEYPKMLTVRNDDGSGVRPAVYPPGHVKQGLAVIFESADEERAHFASRAAPVSKFVPAAKDDD